MFFFTGEGLFCYDGQSLYQSPGGRDLLPLLEHAQLHNLRGTVLGQKLLFAFGQGEDGYNDTLAEYDPRRDCFLLKNGFTVGDMVSFDKKLYHISGQGVLFCWNGQDSFDGSPINALRESPYWDLGSLLSFKRAQKLTLLGRGIYTFLSCDATAAAKEACPCLTIRSMAQGYYAVPTDS